MRHLRQGTGRELSPLVRVAAVLLLMAVLLPPSILWAEETGELVELTLEELLEVQFVPVSVMGGHIHSQGEWMVGYKFMNMEMAGNRDGENNLTPAEVLQGFPVTPLDMTVQMHMFEVMYGLTDRVTLMAMVPYLHKEMDHLTRSGVNFTTETEGVGDVGLMAHVVLSHSGPHWWILTPGVTVPTGSIDERGATPAGPNQKLPYPMQLGSGSIDVVSALHYFYQKPQLVVGVHAKVVFSTGENDDDYQVGDRFHLAAFAARKITDAFSISGRLAGRSVDNYSGADPELNPMVVHTADVSRRGGERIDAALGLNFYFTGGRGDGSAHRFLVEAAVPVFQDLDGPQLETDLNLTVSWQWTL